MNAGVKVGRSQTLETEWIRDLDKMPNQAAIDKAGRIMQRGGLVAFPTETVYGLGGDAFNPDSSRKIYAAKGRPSDNPLIVHICRVSDLEKVAAGIPDCAYRLAEAFWPGPLTMILSKVPQLPKETTGGLDTVAVRLPDHPVALALIEAAGGFVAAPSANTSGRPSPTLGKYVYEDLAGRVDMILDAGQVGIGVESTIVDLTGDRPMILRPGYVTRDMLGQVLGEVALDPSLLHMDSAALNLDPANSGEHPGDESCEEGLRPRAPGMKYKHYAPKGEVIVLEGELEKVCSRLLFEIKKRSDEGRKTGIILTAQMEEILLREAGRVPADSVKKLKKEDDPEVMAHDLFRFFREFDDEGIDAIFVRAVAETGFGLAVMNRLRKAAGGKVVSV